MEFKLDEQAISAMIAENTTKAINQALGGWEVQKAVADLISSEVARGSIEAAIRDAITRIDTEALAATLAKELQSATIHATISILHEGLVETVCKLRGIGTYGDDVQKRREVRAELLGTRK